MSTAPRIPIIIGVGDVVNRSRKLEDAIEPLELMAQAIEKAFSDACPANTASLISTIDSLDVVRSWTWPYPDLPGSLSARLGISPTHMYLSSHGGNQPAQLFDEAARRISTGGTKVALLTGGEALASLSAFAAAKKLPPPGWTKLDHDVDRVFSPTTRELQPDLGAKHGIGAPIHVYPLYENAYRAFRQQSIKQNHDESATLYGDFAKVAEGNEFAWCFKQPAASAEAIATVSKKNRMICFPYPLLMNAFNTVNLAAAIVLTSTEFATELGVPEEKWVYALGGAGTSDSKDFWQRPDFYSSPAISRALDSGLAASGLDNADIDLYDFYSCFPVVPKLASHHLGLPSCKPTTPITLLGGLTSFGGAGNNYSMHAVTEMTRQLRARRGKYGLILANGGVVTSQHVVCLSVLPRPDGSSYPTTAPLEAVSNDAAPLIAEHANGEAVIETYTVEFGKDGHPTRGHVVGRLRDGRRFLANHADDRTLKALCSWETEPIGRSGLVRHLDDGRNAFALHSDARL